jgi:hypothetical protein
MKNQVGEKERERTVKKKKGKRIKEIFNLSMNKINV